MKLYLKPSAYGQCTAYLLWRAAILASSGGTGLVALYVVLVPSMTPLSSLELYNDKRLLQVGILIAVAGAPLASGSARRTWLSTFRALPSFARWGLGVVLGLGLVSAAWSPSPGHAALEVGHFVLLFVLAGIVAAAVRRAPEHTEALLLGAVVLSAGLYAVHFGVSYGLSVAWPALEVGRETISGFANIRHFNQYQTWTLPLLVGATLAMPVRWRAVRGFVFGCAALWWTLILASGVRATVIALIGASIIAWLLFRKYAHDWLRIHLLTAVAGGVLYFFAFYLAGDLTPQVAERISQEGGYTWRLRRWATSLELTGMYPWFGAGPMHFAWPPYHFEPGAHPHNAFLQWLAEWGIPSTGIMSSLAIWGGWRWIQQERANADSSSARSNSIRVALVVTVLAGAAHAMVSGILVMPVSQVLLVLVGGWAWGRYQHKRTRPRVLPSFRVRAIFCGLLLASMTVVGSSLWDLSSIQERRSAYVEAADSRLLWPRYWAQGYIEVRDAEAIEKARKDR